MEISIYVEMHPKEQFEIDIYLDFFFYFPLLCGTLCGAKHFSIKWNNFLIDWSHRSLLNKRRAVIL